MYDNWWPWSSRAQVLIYLSERWLSLCKMNTPIACIVSSKGLLISRVRWRGTDNQHEPCRMWCRQCALSYRKITLEKWFYRIKVKVLWSQDTKEFFPFYNNSTTGVQKEQDFCNILSWTQKLKNKKHKQEKIYLHQTSNDWEKFIFKI